MKSQSVQIYTAKGFVVRREFTTPDRTTAYLHTFPPEHLTVGWGAPRGAYFFATEDGVREVAKRVRGKVESYFGPVIEDLTGEVRARWTEVTEPQEPQP